MRDLGPVGASAAVIEVQLLSRKIGAALGQRESRELSEREALVLRLVVEGMTNQQIATALTLSPHTVHRHIANILIKLRQRTRAAAAAHAITNSLL